jgi:hypothetical protein
MIWTYGGPSFLDKLAELDTGEDTKYREIVRSVVGFTKCTLCYKYGAILNLNNLPEI